MRINTAGPVILVFVVQMIRVSHICATRRKIIFFPLPIGPSMMPVKISRHEMVVYVSLEYSNMKCIPLLGSWIAILEFIFDRSSVLVKTWRISFTKVCVFIAPNAIMHLLFGFWEVEGVL